MTEMTALMKLSTHESMIDVDLRCDAKAVRTIEADFFKETDEPVVSTGHSVSTHCIEGEKKRIFSEEHCIGSC